ncbi:putative acylphosphatase [Aspergillus campestris IBT 28561]|uniref:Acylphosphatase n=1 Tax=Aspergillus campestris (strain IBT 28561) TaxID=1392248 RepID=A0A2I1D065_ASPC2|nr:putative acylphosphatase [Aspergillus campestris IBT 28561]PKY03259.1 putative acylphosphatase [Aspergillus campestris IBT 28561]
MSSQRIAYKVHGTVQGVGFRDFTQKRATHHNLKGFVKNTSCGRVEGEAQGDSESLQNWLKDIHKGPRMAHVVKVEKREVDVRDGESHFGVMRTSESAFDAPAQSS